MNVFLRELRANWKALFWWSFGMVLMIYAGMAKYTAYVDSGQDITAMMNQIPSTLRAALGFGDLDVMKASGFYGMLYLYVLLMVTIHAALLGATIVAKEERDRTSEFLMTRPASRARILTGKLLAAAVNVVVLNLVCLGLSVAVVAQYAHGEDLTSDILLLMGAMLLVQFVFLFLGSAIAAVWKRPKAAASAATTVMLTTYVLSIVVDVNKNLDFLRYLTPFKWFQAAPIMHDQAYQPVYVALAAVVAVACIVATYVGYGKRDLYI